MAGIYNGQNTTRIARWFRLTRTRSSRTLNLTVGARSRKQSLFAGEARRKLGTSTSATSLCALAG